MKFNRSVFILTISVFVCATLAVKEDTDDDDFKGTLPLFLSNRPRIISIFSKPAEPDAPKLTGPNILGHLGNVLHGGSIGVQFQLKPVVEFQGLFGNDKKYVPGDQTYPQVGYPEHQKPPPEPYDPPKGEHWETDEDEKDWEPQNPEKPVKEGPSWEDIGEDPDDDPSIPYEDIINPRVRPQRRPKRYVRDSKIYYIPFISNARVKKMKSINWKPQSLESEKSINTVLKK